MMATTTYNESITNFQQQATNGTRAPSGHVLARGLGFFSIGLGLAELLMPRQLGRIIGVRNNSLVIRLMGVREIGAGIAVLMEPTPRHSMTARIAGDAVDLALLGAGFASRGSRPRRLAGATAAVAGVTALDVVSRVKLGGPILGNGVVQTRQTIAVNKSPQECYELWRDFERLPSFMEHLQSVRVTGEGRSHWIAKAPLGTQVEWDAEVVHDTPNRIAWRSVPGSDIETAGSVEFEAAPSDRGTVIRANIQYCAPGGKAGALIAKLLGEEPSLQAKMDLRRFKSIIETGEVATTEGQPSGR